jgi:hypothetical protein
MNICHHTVVVVVEGVVVELLCLIDWQASSKSSHVSLLPQLRARILAGPGLT